MLAALQQQDSEEKAAAPGGSNDAPPSMPSQDPSSMIPQSQPPPPPLAPSSPNPNPSSTSMMPSSDSSSDQNDGPAPEAPEPAPSSAPSSAPKPKSKPLPKAVAAKATIEVSESSSLDTINIDSGGNWLEKRIWFTKAEQLFDDIRKSVEKASDVKMDFINDVNAIGKKIDDFYEQVSFEKGQIDEMLQNITSEVADALTKRGGDLSENERILQTSVQNEQKQITQIGNDIKKVSEFDDQIEAAMAKAFKTIDACRDLETKAWNNFKSIGAELDDKKARTLYYEMDNFQKNIEQNTAYLQSTLLPYLQTKLITSLEQVMTTIQTNIKTLNQKGIDLDSWIKKYTTSDIALELQREKEREQMVEAAWEQDQMAKMSQQQSAAEAKKRRENEPWYVQYTMSFVDILRCLFCKTMFALQDVGHKIFDMAPGMFDSISSFMTTSWCYITCLFKSMVCSIMSFICHIFGK